MVPDYPAAHSMDATWYAVDKNGHVGLFHTGAGGAVPNDAYSPDALDHYEDLDPEDLEDMGVDTTQLQQIGEQLPDPKRLFVYETGPMDECFADRYERKKAPRNPLHIDQLPPNVRKAIEEVCFETLDFKETKLLQPVELTDCSSWDPAYLASDGKTVKPVPGFEKDYVEYYEQYHAEFTDDGLTFEEPKKRRQPPNKKKKKGK